VPIDEPFGKELLVYDESITPLVITVGIEAAGVSLLGVVNVFSLSDDETTSTDAHPYPTPFMIPDQPALTVCQWLMSIPATTAHPILVNLRTDFSINFFAFRMCLLTLYPDVLLI